MRHLPSFVAVALLATAHVACSAADSAATSDEEIRQGEVDPGNPAVGLLVFASNAICTGTLIAPDVVITAGHCVDEGKIPVAFFTGTGRAVAKISSGDATAQMTRYEVAAGEFIPGYVVTNSCPKEGLDVGLVKLASRVLGIAPARIEGRAPLAAETCVAVGFGKHPGDGDTSTRGEKRRAAVKFRGDVPGGFAFDDLTGGTEKGDSGGPLFCADALVAVNSCGNRPDRFARLDLALPWIEAKLNDWDAPWAGGTLGTILPWSGDAGAPDDGN